MANQTPYYQTVVEKPTAAFALSLVAGIFILLGGLLSMVLPTIIGVGLSFIPGFGGVGSLIILLGALGLVWGILVIVGATMMNSSNGGRVKTGAALVLVFSILSWFGSFGGFFIGFLLGLIGGIKGLAWHPSTPQYVQQQFNGPPPAWGPQPQQIKRFCPQCGRVVEENTNFCRDCGKSLA